MILKFRAWDKERKQMRYQDTEFFYIGLRRGLNGNEFRKELTMSIDNFFTPEQGSLMQFTGLLDGLGKEIYEGDIVRGIGFNSTMRMRVEMHSFCGWPNVPPNQWEVIGNIYEGVSNDTKNSG